MPLPEYRLLPFPQLSLLTVPVAVTLPGGVTGFGDVRFVDIAVLNAGHSVLVGLGATLVFPTASMPATGQGKWQAGPAAAIAFAPENWLLACLPRTRSPSPAIASGPTRMLSSAALRDLSAQSRLVHPIAAADGLQLEDGKQVLPLDLGVVVSSRSAGRT